MKEAVEIMADEMVTLDVRDDLRQGKEPLVKIMAAVRDLAPGQSLKLLATFEPIPLFHVMASKGFSHEARRVGEGDWEVVFTPGRPHPADGGAAGPPKANERPPKLEEDGAWPPPARTLDNRGLVPPEPMIHVLEGIETLADGQVLEVWNDREPMFLYPELEKRGYEIRTEKRDAGVRLEIRRKVVGDGDRHEPGQRGQDR